VELDWERLLAGASTGGVALPSYPFQRTRFWLEPRVAEGHELAPTEPSAPFAVEWAELAIDRQADAPLEVFEHPREDGSPSAALTATEALLGRLQARLSEEPPDEARLAVLTRGAVAAREGECPDPAQAALWGLARSAQGEHPGRFALVDSDGSEASEAALETALAQGAEPQLALREGVALAPRFVPLREGARSRRASLDPERTVLIAGATGGLGAPLARHLVERHGARHLLLASRSGPKAPGAAELRERLEALGASVEIAACDVSDRAQLQGLLGQVPDAHPLGAVFHAAGALADATIAAMAPEQLERPFAPKAQGAWNLHELTAGAELSHFVLFSSAAGILGSPGQGGYAAANAFLDALAQRRHAEGLPATSIAWGLWQRPTGMTSHLGEADLARMGRMGLAPLSDEQGLALLDRALGAAEPLLLAGLAGVPARRESAPASIAERLAALAPAEREAELLALVRAEAAGVLGHASPEEVAPDSAFKDLGLDSLAAVELRNRLRAATGLRLEATLAFDHPIVAELADFLTAEFEHDADRSRDEVGTVVDG
jgi:NAD(P)-dependent dehydrogenase (short-subunit alcohol dehydrogenase family)